MNKKEDGKYLIILLYSKKVKAIEILYMQFF